jgi:hypothetical protein
VLDPLIIGEEVPASIFKSKLVQNLIVTLAVTTLTYVLNHAGELGLPAWASAVITGSVVAINASRQDHNDEHK